MNVTNWTCTLGEQEIVVPAGKTSAVPIICSQNRLQRLLVNYSPNLGYIVRHVLSTAAGPVVRELTAYQRLSTKDDGEELKSWESFEALADDIFQPYGEFGLRGPFFLLVTKPPEPPQRQSLDSPILAYHHYPSFLQLWCAWMT